MGEWQPATDWVIYVLVWTVVIIILAGLFEWFKQRR